jgi:hypothetical protein
MLTARRHRYLTRWPRRLAFAVVILLLLAASWRAYHAWQPRHLATPEPPSQAV